MLQFLGSSRQRLLSFFCSYGECFADMERLEDTGESAGEAATA